MNGSSTGKSVDSPRIAAAKHCSKEAEASLGKPVHPHVRRNYAKGYGLLEQVIESEPGQADLARRIRKSNVRRMICLTEQIRNHKDYQGFLAVAGFCVWDEFKALIQDGQEARAAFDAFQDRFPAAKDFVEVVTDINDSLRSDP